LIAEKDLVKARAAIGLARQAADRITPDEYNKYDSYYRIAGYWMQVGDAGKAHEVAALTHSNANAKDSAYGLIAYYYADVGQIDKAREIYEKISAGYSGRKYFDQHVERILKARQALEDASTDHERRAAKRRLRWYDRPLGPYDPPFHKSLSPAQLNAMKWTRWARFKYAATKDFTAYAQSLEGKETKFIVDRLADSIRDMMYELQKIRIITAEISSRRQSAGTP